MDVKMVSNVNVSVENRTVSAGLVVKSSWHEEKKLIIAQRIISFVKKKTVFLNLNILSLVFAVLNGC